MTSLPPLTKLRRLHPDTIIGVRAHDLLAALTLLAAQQNAHRGRDNIDMPAVLGKWTT